MPFKFQQVVEKLKSNYKTTVLKIKLEQYEFQEKMSSFGDGGSVSEIQ